jgi:hypothetical protein
MVEGLMPPRKAAALSTECNRSGIVFPVVIYASLRLLMYGAVFLIPDSMIPSVLGRAPTSPKFSVTAVNAASR